MIRLVADDNDGDDDDNDGNDDDDRDDDDDGVAHGTADPEEVDNQDADHVVGLFVSNGTGEDLNDKFI